MRISGSACEEVRRAFYIQEILSHIYKTLRLGYTALKRYIHFKYRRVEICIICKQKPVLTQRIFYGNTKENAEISTMRGQSSDMYKITVSTNPKVVNRRKYPRMPLSNKCTITVKQTGKQYNGQMINLSAGGFAFSVRDNFFASAIGSDITLSIPDLPVENARQLEGHIIRSTDDENIFIVGCRMPEDNTAVEQYVRNNYQGE